MKRAHGYWGDPAEQYEQESEGLPPPPDPRRDVFYRGDSEFARRAPPPPPPPHSGYDYDRQPPEDDLGRYYGDEGLGAYDVGAGGGDYGGGFGGGGEWGVTEDGGGFGGGGGADSPPPQEQQQQHHYSQQQQVRARPPPAAWAVQAVRDAAAAAAGVPVTGGQAAAASSMMGAPPPAPAAMAGRFWRPPGQQQQQQQQQQQNPPPPAAAPAPRPTRFMAVFYGGGVQQHQQQQQGQRRHAQQQGPAAPAPAPAGGAPLGLAFFDADTRELGLLQASDERRGPAAFETLTEAVLQLRPQVLCLSAKAGADVVDAARRALALAAAAERRQQQADAAAAAEEEGTEQAPAQAGPAPSCGAPQEGTVRFERAALFGYDQARAVLESALPPPSSSPCFPSAGGGGGGGGGASGAGTAGGGNVGDGCSNNIELSPGAGALQVCAGGALIALLRRERVLAPEQGGDGDAENDGDGEDGDDGDGRLAGPTRVLRCVPLPLPARVDVDPGALRFLGVFRAAHHPSRMGIGAGRREGRGSLFALLSARCRTQSGRRLMRHWLSRPLADLPAIRARQDAVAALLSAPREPWQALQRALAPAQDLAALVSRLRLAQGRPDPAAYRQLLGALAALRELRDAAAILLLHEQGEESARPAASVSVAGGGGGGGGSGVRGGQSSEQRPIPPPLARLPAASRLHAAVDEAAFAECARLVEETLEIGAGPAGAAAAAAGQAAGGGAGSAAAAALVESGTLVRPGVCAPLDRLRAAYHALPDALTTAVDAELARIPPSAATAHAAVIAPPQPAPSSSAAAAATGAAAVAADSWAADAAVAPRAAAPPVSRIRFSILYLPQVGFVMAVGGGRLGPSMLEALPDFEYAFANAETGAAFTAFYCCDATRRLNRRWGDLMWRIQDLEAAISAALVRRVIDGAAGGRGGGGGGGGVGAALLAAAPAVAELDALAALASAARDYGWSRPRVTAGTRLDVDGGRDPLVEARALRLEGSAAGLVPNDTRIGSDDDEEGREERGEAGAGRGAAAAGDNSPRRPGRVLVVMGPNASGKSVFARQALLIALLAHVGSFVPAQRATVGLADRLIVVATGGGGSSFGGGGAGAGLAPDAPSAADDGGLSGRRPSSFQCDLLRVGAAMRVATRRSIVLLDEFGSGTLSCDGAGLLAAVLERWGSGGGGMGGGGGGGIGGGGNGGLTAAAPSPASPRVLACTHFTELLDPAVLDPRRAPRLRFLSMGVIVRAGPAAVGRAGVGGAGGGGGGDARQRRPVFLYRAEPNPARAAPAFGVECARLAGVPACVTTRAAAVLRIMTGATADGSAAAAAAGEEQEAATATAGGGGAAAAATAAAADSGACAAPLMRLPRNVAPLPLLGAAEDDALAASLERRMGRLRVGSNEGDEGGAAAAASGAASASGAAAEAEASWRSLLEDALGYELGGEVAAAMLATAPAS